jgi:MinD superfamily P-loop ATPase
VGGGIMKELVVISGKGGTGKTSIVAAFATLAKRKVLADCDVDAADLHLILAPKIIRRESFIAGREAIIRLEDCFGCGSCVDVCRFGAILPTSNEAGETLYAIDPLACEGCGVCVRTCPLDAIDFPERECGEWYVSDTRHGPMVHARLGIAAENSGKLVTRVRQAAHAIAEERGLDLIIVDGPPGIGCPVIASVTGVSLVLVVIEPTLSGIHDMKRVVELTRHFKIPTILCINKWDLNPTLATRMEHEADQAGIRMAGKIHYDPNVTRAQIAGQSLVDFQNGDLAGEFRSLWRNVHERLEQHAAV